MQVTFDPTDPLDIIRVRKLIDGSVAAAQADSLAPVDAAPVKRGRPAKTEVADKPAPEKEAPVAEPAPAVAEKPRDTTTPAAEAPAAPAKPMWTIDDVKQALVNYSKAASTDPVKGQGLAKAIVVKEGGFERLSEVKAESYGKIMDAVAAATKALSK